MKNKTVNFIPGTKDSEIMVPVPKPSIKYIPKWFKDIPSEIATLDNKKMDKTGKHCMPFIDSLSSGYIQELPCDLEIKNDGIDDNGNDIITYRWAGDIRPCSTRREETNSRNMLPNFDGYYNIEFHWITNWEPRTPKGYSTMYHHPSNRFDLPFHTLTGIIDTDSWSITGPLPFLIKKGFEGIISAGTPIYQITFIKREDWTSKQVEYDEIFQKKHLYNVKKFFYGGYKKLYWNRKNFS
jgi:hypothetical protein